MLMVNGEIFHYIFLSRLKVMGGLDRKLVEDGEVWRLFSCIWLHAGVVHLLVNMLSLLVTGVRLEGEFGFCKRLLVSKCQKTEVLYGKKFSTNLKHCC